MRRQKCEQAENRKPLDCRSKTSSQPERGKSEGTGEMCLQEKNSGKDSEKESYTDTQSR